MGGRDALKMEPVEQHTVREVGELSHFGEAEPEIVVLRGGQGDVVAAEAIESIAADEGGGVDDAPADASQMVAVDGVMVQWHSPMPERTTIGVDQQGLSANGDAGRVGVQMSDLLFQPIEEGNVVGIHPGQVLAMGKPGGFVERPGQALIRARMDPDTTVAGSDVCEQSGCAVGRAVVNDDELEIRKGLVQDAFDCLRQKGFAVVDGQQDRNLRLVRLHRCL